MIANFLTVAWRTIIRNRVSTIINICGLTLGMAAFVLIIQYVAFEKSVNKFHSKLDNISRVLYEVSYGGNTFTWESTPPAVATMAKDEFPEVNNYCRVFKQNGVVSWQEVAGREPKTFRETTAAYADESFFSIFTFPLVDGDATGLGNPNTVMLSESTAKKYFGAKNAIGKVLSMDDQFGARLFTVVGVFKDFPENSDLQYGLIFSLQTLANPANLGGNEAWARLDNYNSQFIETYLLTHDGTDRHGLEQKLNAAIKQHKPDITETLRLQSMANVHLPQSLSDYYTTAGSLQFLYLLEASALMILVIAWFNYINLSTAGAMKRAKEVGVRKVIGASRWHLVRQFLGESVLINLVAIVVAFALVNILQPSYNAIIGKNLSLAVVFEGWGWVSLIAFIIVGAIAAGSYAAFSLSSFRPSETLRGTFSKSSKGVWLRKSLVVFQFSISIILIGSTIILFRQTEFMQDQDLGVTLDQRLVLAEPTVGADSTRRQRSESFVNTLSQQAFVKNYSMSGSVPGNSFNYKSGGLTRLNPEKDDDKINYAMTFIDDRYLEVYGVKLMAGKNFTSETVRRNPKERNTLILNEAAIRLLGFETPAIAVGQKILYYGKQFEITGVVSDYHHQSMKEVVDATVFFPALNTHYFTVQLEPGQIKTGVSEIEKLYKASFPGNPFEFFFADENFNKHYKAEQQYTLIFTIASLLAIFIACLGLLGLARFTVEQRVKEIGIRKVLGASVGQIVQMLSNDFLILVFVSLLIATPLSWWGMTQWLQTFPYRIEITGWVYAGTGVAAVLIAMITVGLQSIKASRSNPVDALKID